MNITATIDIKRPTSEVFDFVMEVPHDSQWRTGVAEAAITSDEPLGVGTTGFDRISKPTVEEMVSTWTVFEYEPGGTAGWANVSHLTHL